MSRRFPPHRLGGRNSFCAARALVAVVAVVTTAALARASVGAASADDGSARIARVRESAALANDRGEIDALVRDADGFSSGARRIDARMLAAQAYLGRFDAPAEGRALLRKVAADGSIDALTAAQATDLLVRADLDADLVDDARADAAKNRVYVGRELAAVLATRVRRRAVHRAALVLLVGVAVAIGASVRRAVRAGRGRATVLAVRDLAPVAVGFGAVVATAGGGLAALFAEHAAAPFVALGAALVPVVLLARAWSAAQPRPAARAFGRAARALACAAAALASAFLVLERVDATYLASFGL